MTQFRKKYLEDDVVCADPLPTEAELSDYYAQVYYQESDGQKTTYDNVYTASELDYKKLESRMTLQGMKENLEEDIKKPAILDLGCGEGFLVKEAVEQGYTIKGVDFSDYGVKKWNPDILNACEFGNIYDFLNDEAKNQHKYDVCILRNVLEHVINPAALLIQIDRILNPSGIALITVPNDYSALQDAAMKKGYIDKEFWFAPPDHLYYFNTKNIHHFMKKNNFSVIDMFSSFPVDFFLFHSGSNYIADKSKGKEAHYARIDIDLLIAKEGIDKFLNLYRAMADCGIGRDFTVVIQKK